MAVNLAVNSREVSSVRAYVRAVEFRVRKLDHHLCSDEAAAHLFADIGSCMVELTD